MLCMDDEIADQLRLDAIVTLVDSAHVIAHLDEERPEGVENEAVEQIAFADRIVLNQTDLATDEQLCAVAGRIRAINAVAPVLPVRQADVDQSAVLDVRAFDLGRALELDPAVLTDGDHQHDTSVSSVGLEVAGEVDVERLNDWLGNC
jgi:G3E family GTPase